MKIACIYWNTSSVGGIATHLNTLRTAALRAGDNFDILQSSNWKTKKPTVFSERKWVRGGDTRIWIDGEIPQTKEAARWLEANYDAVVYGFICPHKTKAYPEPDFLPLYDVGLPKAAFIMDGYWDDYSHWAEPLLPRLSAVLCPQESYASPLPSSVEVVISPFPFAPSLGKAARRSEKPLVVWPNQWKNIKGINGFLGSVPSLPSSVDVEMYSNGIRYYQLRTEDVWKKAVAKDLFKGYDGEGRAVFFGNVDLPEIMRAYQRAWFTVNLQGMRTKKAAYKLGSYNNTEVEALWYGACPILHESTKGTRMPDDIYLWVSEAEEIPKTVAKAIESGFAICPERRRRARDFVKRHHLASRRYSDLREVLK